MPVDTTFGWAILQQSSLKIVHLKHIELILRAFSSFFMDDITVNTDGRAVAPHLRAMVAFRVGQAGELAFIACAIHGHKRSPLAKAQCS